MAPAQPTTSLATAFFEAVSSSPLVGILAVAMLVSLLWALSLRRQIHEHRAKARRHMSREAMLQSRHRELLDVISDIVLVLTADGRFFEMNRAAQRAFGASADDLAGISILSRIAPHDRQKLTRLLAGDNDGLGDGILELDVRDHRGFSHVIQLTAWRPISSGGGGFRVIARDVTSLKAAEFAVAELHSRLHGDEAATP